MTKLILAALAGIRNVCALALWLFKRYGSKEAKVQKKEKRLEDVMRKMQEIRNSKEPDMVLYYRLNDERLRLAGEIADLRK